MTLPLSETARTLPGSRREPAASPRKLLAVELAGLAVLCVLALALRLRGIGFLLPVMPLSDSLHVVRQVEQLRGTGDAAADEFPEPFYPLLLARATAWLPDPRRAVAGARSLDEHLRLASEPWRQIRVVSAVLSVLIVPATWLLARRFLSGPWPLVAAAFVATSLLHVTFAAQEKPHGPVAAFLALAVAAGLRLRSRGDVASHLLFGAAAGLAIGALHSGVFALLALPAAVFLRERRPGRASAWWLVAALVLVALAVRFFYPFHFHGSGTATAPGPAGPSMLDISGHRISLDKLRGRGFAVVLETMGSYDPLLLAASALGLAVAVVALFRRRLVRTEPRAKDLAVVLSVALPYFLAFGMYDYNFERFVMPLTPFLACLGAFGLSRCLPIAAGAALPALALVPAWKLGSVRAAPDTYARAAECVEKIARPDVDPIVVVPYIDLPLMHGDAALTENSKFPWRSNWVRYQMKLAPEERVEPRFEVLVSPKTLEEVARALREDPLGYFREYRARFVVLVVDPDRTRLLSKVREALRADADLVCRLSPETDDHGDDPAYYYRHIDDPRGRPFFRFVMDLQSMGPALEVYRLR